MSKVNWFRSLSMFAVFGIVAQFTPDFVKWGLLGYALTLLAIKMESYHDQR